MKKISRFLPELLAICLIGLLPKSGFAADVSATWLDGIGNWSDATQWNTNPNYPNNGNGLTYDATINNGGATLDQDITIQRLYLNGGGIYLLADITLNEGLTWTGGSLGGMVENPAAINLAAGSTSTLAGQGLSDVTINNSGSINQTIQIGYVVANNLAGATWEMPDNGFQGFLNNAGTLVVHGDFFTGGNFNNSGVVTVEGTLFFFLNGGTSSGTFNVETLFFRDLGYSLTTGATINADLVQMGETELVVAGNTTINSEINIANSLLQIKSQATLTFTGALSSGDRASVHLDGAIKSSQTLHFEQGRLSGSGIANADISHNGIISPGGTQTLFFTENYVNSPGALVINGNVSLLSDAKIVMEIGGLIQGTEYDHLTVSGLVALNGTLILEMINGFEMQLGDNQTFTLLTSGDVIGGAFANVANGARLVTTDGSASFQVNYGPGSLFEADDLVLSDPEIVPEPGTWMLLVVGAALIGFVRFRRQQVYR